MKEYIVTDYGVKSNSKAFQTEKIQAVIDLCKDEGGRVVIPAGEYYVASLRLPSNTVLYLKADAKIYGSDEVDEYTVYDIPKGVNTRTDRDLFAEYFENAGHYDNYRKAIISAYGEKNVSIIGEKNSVIDGRDCFDADGEEGFRGPHGIFMSCCENVILRGYTIMNTGNFMHQIDNSKNIVLDGVTMLAGHDGAHLHLCENVTVENCKFITGDDCIAGVNINKMTVKKNFRVGGRDILIENCRLYGPGYYPHRMTVVKGKRNYLPREEGRHNTLSAFIYFASERYPDTLPHNITFKNCTIENIDSFMHYDCDNAALLEGGAHLREINLENVKMSGLVKSSVCNASSENPLIINLKNTDISFADSAESTEAFGDDKLNVKINKIV